MSDYTCCPRCGMRSDNPEDVKHRYCGFCHKFHDDQMDDAKFLELRHDHLMALNLIEEMVKTKPALGEDPTPWAEHFITEMRKRAADTTIRKPTRDLYALTAKQIETQMFESGLLLREERLQPGEPSMSDESWQRVIDKARQVGASFIRMAAGNDKDESGKPRLTPSQKRIGFTVEKQGGMWVKTLDLNKVDLKIALTPKDERKDPTEEHLFTEADRKQHERLLLLRLMVQEQHPEFDFMVVGNPPLWVKMAGHPRLREALEAALIVLNFDDERCEQLLVKLRELGADLATQGPG